VCGPAWALAPPRDGVLEAGAASRRGPPPCASGRAGLSSPRGRKEGGGGRFFARGWGSFAGALELHTASKGCEKMRREGVTREQWKQFALAASGLVLALVFACFTSSGSSSSLSSQFLLAFPPVADAQWTGAPLTYGPPDWVQGAYETGNSFWQSFLASVGMGDGSGAPIDASSYVTTQLEGFSVEEIEEMGSGDPELGEDRDKLVDIAHLHLVKLLLNTTRELPIANEAGGKDSVSELGAAQAIAYYEDGSEQQGNPESTKSIIEFLYDKVLNATEAADEDALKSWIEGNMAEGNRTVMDQKVMAAIREFPEEVWRDLIFKLNETMADEAVNSTMGQAPLLVPDQIELNTQKVESEPDAKEEEEVNTSLRREEMIGRLPVVVEESSEDEEEGYCLINEFISQTTCYGVKETENDEVCITSIMNEALQMSGLIRDVYSSSFSILFMPSDSAVLRLLKFAQISPMVALNTHLMAEVVKRHAVLYSSDEYKQNPMRRTGIESLLLSETDKPFTILELPDATLMNVPKIYIIMQRPPEEETSLYFTSTLPKCDFTEYKVEDSDAQFYSTEGDECMMEYLEFCKNPSFDNFVPGQYVDSYNIENPCGIAQLLDVKVCNDGVVFPVNNLLLNSEESANFLAILAGMTSLEGEFVPTYEWFFTNPPPLLNSGMMKDVEAFAIGKMLSSDFKETGMDFNGNNFLYVPDVDLSGESTSICFTLMPNYTSGQHVIFSMSDQDNGSEGNISIKAVEKKTSSSADPSQLSTLEMRVGSMNVSTSLTLQNGIQSNIAIVIDGEKGSWTFYDSGWIIHRQMDMPPFPSSIAGAAFIGRPVVQSGSPSEYWEGSIKDMRIFDNQVLTAQEIMQYCGVSPTVTQVTNPKGEDTSEEHYFKSIEELNKLLSSTKDGDTVIDESSVRSKTDLDVVAPSDGTGTDNATDNEAGGDGEDVEAVTETDSTTGICLDMIASHLKEVESSSTSAGRDYGEGEVIPEYMYEFTESEANSGSYNYNGSEAIPVGMDTNPFSQRGVHFDGQMQHIIIPDIALVGVNATIGFTFALDSFERAHQTLFQLISKCKNFPMNFYIQARVNSGITGAKDFLQVSLNNELISISAETFLKRKETQFAVVFEGEVWHFYLEAENVATITGQPLLPPLFGIARVGSENSFAGFIKDLYIFDHALSPEQLKQAILDK